MKSSWSILSQKILIPRVYVSQDLVLQTLWVGKKKAFNVWFATLHPIHNTLTVEMADSHCAFYI